MPDLIIQALAEYGNRAYQDVSPLPDLAASVLSRHRRRRQIERMTAAALAVLLAGGGAAAAVLVGNTSDRQILSPRPHAPAAPCAEPPSSAGTTLTWPCPDRPVTPYYQRQFQQPQIFAAAATINTVKPQMRVLAYGRLPHSRAGSTVVVGEIWSKTGEHPKLFTDYAVPARFVRYLQVSGPGGTPIAQESGAQSVPSGQPALLVLDPPRLPPTAGGQTCATLAATPPKPRHGYLAGCTDVVAARSDIATLRILHHGSRVGPTVPVHNGLAGLPAPDASRPGWAIQGLAAAGRVVDTVHWQPSP